MSKMFKTVTRTWNPFTGCKFDCTYCWARRLAEGKLKSQVKYANGFEPTFHPEELAKKFKPGELIFVCSMGDISWAAISQVNQILDIVKRFPNTDFLIQSKAPDFFDAFDFPKNTYLGTTIETNRDTYSLSKAPSPQIRAKAMELMRSKGNRTFLSIEPIIDFDIEEMLLLIEMVWPKIIEIGADNYQRGLPEPSPEKLATLLRLLNTARFYIVEKDGLDRLK